MHSSYSSLNNCCQGQHEKVRYSSAGAALGIRPFRAHVDEEKLTHLKKLLELSPTAPPVFENTNTRGKYGIEREWLMKAKQIWLNDFDWRTCEDRIDSFPNFPATEDAIPIVLFHGWPRSICEFLNVLDLLRQRYSSRHLPYVIIFPSLPGCTHSSGPPLEQDYTIEDAAALMHNLPIGLDFCSGYLAHGGDLDSFVSRVLALKYDACKGIHVNLMVSKLPPNGLTPTEAEVRALEKAKETFDTGYAFGLEQGTRPATLGFALSASPLSLLSWLGEKFLERSDEAPAMEKILEDVTLYCMTDTIARYLYHSRDLGSKGEKPKIARTSEAMKGPDLPFIAKPSGYLLFAQEIVRSPRSMAARSYNLVWLDEHERGGHFAAMERPNKLLGDVEGYAHPVWRMIQGK